MRPSTSASQACTDEQVRLLERFSPEFRERAQGDAGDALKTIEVTLLDQVIVTSTAVLSFRTKGLL